MLAETEVNNKKLRGSLDEARTDYRTWRTKRKGENTAVTMTILTLQ